MNTIKIDISKMSNYSVFEGKEIESLNFFYYCCHENRVVDEINGSYIEEKNTRCFERFEDALDYINSLDSERGWQRRIDEFFVNQEENTVDLYSNICLEAKDDYWHNLVDKYSFNN